MNLQEKALEGKNSIITGANRGIGLKIVEKFAKSGSNIIACCRKENKDFLKIVSNLKNKYRIKIMLVYFDLENKEQIKKSFEDIKKQFDHIDILVNNAATIETSNFMMTSTDNMKKMFDINYFSQIYLIQLVSKMMIGKKKGNIVNIASTAGIDSNEGRISYSASKSALINSSKILSKELSPFNIRVNVVAPGLVETEMMKKNTKNEIIKQVINNLTIKRVGKPEEIANVVHFLASDSSSYINGQVIRVDGGML